MATVPSAPDPITFSSIAQTRLYAKFTGNSNGGSAILQWQMGWGSNSTEPVNWVTAAGAAHTFENLAPATTYYFWARGRNAVGWGPYSARRSVRTVAGARVKVGAVWKEAVPYVRVGGIWKVAQPWVKFYGAWTKTG